MCRSGECARARPIDKIITQSAKRRQRPAELSRSSPPPPASKTRAAAAAKRRTKKSRAHNRGLMKAAQTAPIVRMKTESFWRVTQVAFFFFSLVCLHADRRLSHRSIHHRNGRYKARRQRRAASSTPRRRTNEARGVDDARRSRVRLRARARARVEGGDSKAPKKRISARAHERARAQRSDDSQRRRSIATTGGVDHDDDGKLRTNARLEARARAARDRGVIQKKKRGTTTSASPRRRRRRRKPVGARPLNTTKKQKRANDAKTRL